MADRQESAARIAEFSNPKSAQEYLDFCAECAQIHQALRDSFMVQPLQGSGRFMWRLLQDQQRLQHLLSMWRAPPWQNLWSALGQRFTDPRLRQLFARYATYVGSSPLAAPATLMLIAHVEQEGVWLIQGGMQQLAIAMGRVAERCGATTHYQTPVKKIIVERGQIRGLETMAGDTLQCDAVIFNGDAQALATGLLGEDARMGARAITRAERGLSAITWCRYARTQGVDLAYHNVFFANNYPKEFTDIFEKRDVTDTPTVYLCAQDRGLGTAPDGAERMLLLVNAPADGDQAGIDEEKLVRIEASVA
jgi:1-hydroxycarotenoid 3,4-desaturase